MQFTDAAVIGGVRKTADGYLVADCLAVRTGIQLYRGSEVGRPEMDVVRVYRPEAEVFAKDSVASFGHVPLTDDHPKDLVTAETWKDVAVGETAGEVLRDGERLRIPLIVKDAAAIRKVEDGKRELSAGYTCDLAFEGGQTPQGEAYDAIQKNIRANHVAIVRQGRAGSECRIGDAAAHWGASPVITAADERNPDMPDNLRKVLVDGLQVETTDAGATAIDKLLKDIAASAAKLTDAETAHKSAIEAKDKELAKKDAEIDDLKKKVVDGAALDKLVAARADLIGKAKVIAKDVKTDGLSDADIRKAAVAAALGDDAIKDKAEAYIDARFDILVEDAAKKQPDAFRQAVQTGIQPTNDGSAADKAHAAYVSDMSTAWKGETKGAA